MELRVYLCIHRIPINKFAKRLNITRQHLGAVINKRYNASWQLCALIEKETNGEVTSEEISGKKELPIFE